MKPRFKKNAYRLSELPDRRKRPALGSRRFKNIRVNCIFSKLTIEAYELQATSSEFSSGDLKDLGESKEIAVGRPYSP